MADLTGDPQAPSADPVFVAFEQAVDRAVAITAAVIDRAGVRAAPGAGPPQVVCAGADLASEEPHRGVPPLEYLSMVEAALDARRTAMTELLDTFSSAATPTEGPAPLGSLGC